MSKTKVLILKQDVRCSYVNVRHNSLAQYSMLGYK